MIRKRFENALHALKTGITSEYAEGVKFQFGSNTPDDIRKAGYSVAVHNDYKMHETDYTSWLITKLVDNQLIAFKGEGISDAFIILKTFSFD